MAVGIKSDGDGSGWDASSTGPANGHFEELGTGRLAEQTFVKLRPPVNVMYNV